MAVVASAGSLYLFVKHNIRMAVKIAFLYGRCLS